MKSPAFARHEALLDQAWRTMKDSIILKSTYERPEGSSFYEKRPGEESAYDFAMRMKRETHSSNNLGQPPPVNDPATHQGTMNDQHQRAMNKLHTQNTGVAPSSSALGSLQAADSTPLPDPKNQQDLAAHVNDKKLHGQEVSKPRIGVTDPETQRLREKREAAAASPIAGGPGEEKEEKQSLLARAGISPKLQGQGDAGTGGWGRWAMDVLTA